jgi:hypothetical protein
VLTRRETKHPSRLCENPVLTTTPPQRHLIGVEVAFAVRLGAGLASGVALLMVLALAKLRGQGSVGRRGASPSLTLSHYAVTRRFHWRSLAPATS